jgi:hypothetical protein
VKTVRLTADNDTTKDEGRETHVVTHTVTETGVAASQLTVGNISIIVDDNDSTPSVTTGQSYTVKKSVSVNANFATAVATDADSSDKLTYSIAAQVNASGNAVDLFQIDSNLGSLSAKSDLSSSAGTYGVSVKVVDNAGNNDSQTVTIIVSSSEVNSAPTLNDTTATISESAAKGTAIATLSASDADGDSLTYEITSGNADNLFSLGAVNGLLTFNKNAVSLLDYETKPSYSLSIKASDAESSTTGIVTINLIDENDNVPKFADNSPTSASLSVAAASGTTVATFSASDPDGDTLTYSLSGNGSSFFSINSSGVITTSKALAATGTVSYWLGSTPLVKNKAFSFETVGTSGSNSVEVIVSATDTGSKTASAPLSVIFPDGDTSVSKSSGSSDGVIDFGDLSNGASYLAKSAVSHSSDINLTFPDDVQALVDSLSGKTALSSSAGVTAAADFNLSGKIDLADSTGLARAIVDETGSSLVLFDTSDSSSITVSPATSLSLNAVLLGDVNGSYATILA